MKLINKLKEQKKITNDEKIYQLAIAKKPLQSGREEDYITSLKKTLFNILKDKERDNTHIVWFQGIDKLLEVPGGGSERISPISFLTHIVKEFLENVTTKEEFKDVYVFAEADSLLKIPPSIRTFFPHKKTCIPPSKEEREKILKKFERGEMERTLREVYPKEDSEIIAKLVEKYSLDKIEDDLKNKIIRTTTGLTHREYILVLKRVVEWLKKNNSSTIDIPKDLLSARSSIDWLSVVLPETSWDDVIIEEKNKERIKKYTNPKREIRPKGLLFYGPPGTGKTMLAKAIATGNKGYFIRLGPAQIHNKYFGESERLLKEVFQLSKDLSESSDKPVVLFVDEIDGFAPTRNTDENRPESSVLSVFLSELDGIEKLNNVIVIGATNRIDRIDTALLRPGRLSPLIKVPLPDSDDYMEFFKNKLKTVRKITSEGTALRLGEKVKNLEKYPIKELTKILSGADLEEIVRRIGYNNKGPDSFDFDKELVENIIEEIINEKVVKFGMTVDDGLDDIIDRLEKEYSHKRTS